MQKAVIGSSIVSGIGKIMTNLEKKDEKKA